MNRIDLRFKYLKKTKQKAFVPFITAGFPNLEITRKLVLEFDSLGADVIELGVPFSDPLADGPTIQQASGYALKKGITLSKIFNLVKNIRKSSEVAIALMTYYNPVLRFGVDRFILNCAKAQVDAVILPDVPPEEAKDFINKAKVKNIQTICFLSPTSDKSRIKLVSSLASGFIYYVSLTGVTGARSSLRSDIKEHVRQIKSSTKCPVCVGFGISKPEHVRYINSFADGVIVGSAIVKIIQNNIANPKRIIKEASSLVKKLCIKKSL